MKVRILGCSGGVGGPALRTTAMLVDDDILIDAGTGVEDLSLAELARIDHVFITHSHLDHVLCLPLLIDAVADRRQAPISVYSSAATLSVLGRHIFNWDVWPDFGAISHISHISHISQRGSALLSYQPIAVGEAVHLGARTITALPAEHTVPALGYRLDSAQGCLVFTGDTTANDRLWPIVNAIDKLRYLIIEAAFPDRDRALAVRSKHLCPALLAAELARLERDAEIYVSHLKPGQSELIMGEIAQNAGRHQPRMLVNDQFFEF